MLGVEDLVEDADVFLHGIEPDDGFGFAVQWTDEEHGNAAYLEDTGDVGVVIDVNAVKVHLALIMLGDVTQDGRQTAAGPAPVGIEVDNDWTWAAHGPVMGCIVGNVLLELLLIDGMYGINGIWI